MLVLAALAGVVGGGLLGFLLISEDEPGRVVEAGVPTEASVEDLRSFAHSLGHVVYWAGVLPGRKLELTHSRSGDVFVRYLPNQAPIGDRSPDFTTVATYPRSDAYAATDRAARRRGAVKRRAPGGGLAVGRKRSRSVYLAYPGSDFLVEVYDPSERGAWNLALSGRVGPVR